MVMPDEAANGGGLRIGVNRAEIPPTEDDDQLGGGDDSGPAWGPTYDQPGDAKVPDATVSLNPAIIKFSINGLGNGLAEITQYPGWRFTDEEVEALTEAIAMFGITFSPMVNLILTVSAIVMGKATAYAMWVRAGRPAVSGQTRNLLEQGQQEYTNGVGHEGV